ncbi:MAG: hypothetical protein KatS3mg043_1328 [Rhodothermaceae bacterium]|nr:MAG: hypothetical protein KatS3mg043_1328 [Rhodothermaceae bacterium]
MPNESFRVSPVSQSFGTHEIYPHLRRDRRHDTWHVTLVLTRPPDLPPVRGEDLTVQLHEADGRSFDVRERPAGPQVEVGNSRGVSVNAEFVFAGAARLPATLSVSYRGQTALFHIHPPPEPPR